MSLFVIRDNLLNSLREEQSVHRKQLKQLQVALQTSLSHIRGLKVSASPPRGTILTSHQVLMQQSSPGSIQSEIDEAALKDLLQLVPNRPRLTGLKLCLADLRRDVKELNLQLGDRYWKYLSKYFTVNHTYLVGLGVPPQQDL